MFVIESLLRRNKKLLRAEDSQSNVDVVHGKKVKPVGHKSLHKMNPFTGSEICTRCGKRSHVGRQQCPAQNAICQRCHKHGHFQVMCRTKTVKVVSAEDSEDESFVGVIEHSEFLIIPTVSNGTEPWTVPEEFLYHQNHKLSKNSVVWNNWVSSSKLIY